MDPTPASSSSSSSSSPPSAAEAAAAAEKRASTTLHVTLSYNTPLTTAPPAPVNITTIATAVRPSPGAPIAVTTNAKSSPDTGKPRKAKKKHRKDAEALIASQDEEGTPRLLGVERINTARRQEHYKKNVPVAVDADESRDQLSSLSDSITVKVIGGVAQPVTCRDGASSQNVPVMRKKPSHGKPRNGSTRRVSCKDLGAGDCNGWLHKKKESGLRSKWIKRWFILKEHSLFYYKDKECETADGRINLIGFKVSHSPKTKSKEFAFKVDKDKIQILLAADSKEDGAKWMNMISLATIDIPRRYLENNAAFNKPTVKSPTDHNLKGSDSIRSLPALRTQPKPSRGILRIFSFKDRGDPDVISEGEDNDTDSESCQSSPNISRRGSEDSILDPSKALYPSESSSVSKLSLPSCSSEGGSIDDLQKLIRIEAKSRSDSRRSKIASVMAPVHLLHLRHSQELAKSRKLSSLERSLKDKEHQLEVIEDLLKMRAITGATLRQARSEHPSVFLPMEDPDHVTSSSDSNSEG